MSGTASSALFRATNSDRPTPGRLGAMSRNPACFAASATYDAW